MRSVLGKVAAVALLLLFGAQPGAAQRTDTVRVAVDGHRLFLLTSGAGGPTVVLEAGDRSTHRAWNGLRQRLAGFPRVVVYDRAGHAIQTDRPDTVVTVIRNLQASARITPPAGDDSAVAAWASGRALPFSLAGDGPVPGLASLVARSRVIGVGESVHDQHEFLALRFRLLRSLVARHRVTALVLESGLPEGIALDRWVTGQAGTVDFDAALKYGFGGHAEVREAMQWLRRWNLGAGRAHPVRVYGIDLPASAGSMIPALDRLAELGSDAAMAGWINRSLRPLATRVSGPFWRPASSRYDSLSQAAKDSLQAAAAELVAKTAGRSDWEARLGLVVQQTETMLRLGAYHLSNPRDQAMADNTEWVLDRLRPGERVVLWAHNAHVQRVPIEGPAELGGGAAPSMGTMLRARLGLGYVAIGTSYGGPSVDSATAPAAGSIDKLLDGVTKAAPFLVPLEPLPAAGPVRSWLEAKRPMRFQSGHLELKVALAFDGVVFVRRVRPADPASRNHH